jgi:hypothetical protein
MKRNISVCIVAALILLPVLCAEASSTSEIKPLDSPTSKSAEAPASQLQKEKGLTSAIRLKERPSFKMICPDVPEVTLNISYTMGGWGLNPSQLRPTGFTRAYATVDSSDKTKVTLACLYQVTADYLAKTQYNGLQKCICNESTGEGMVGYTGPGGFTMNVVGTSAHGKLPVKKTGQQVKNQTLECQFHADGQAQFFKKFQATGPLSTCQANGREVTCPY